MTCLYSLVIGQTLRQMVSPGEQRFAARPEQPRGTTSSQLRAAKNNGEQLEGAKGVREQAHQPRANLSNVYASCAHEMRRVRRDRASAAGCATTRATTTTRNATPTAMHAVLRICIVKVGSQGQLITVRSSQEQTRATKSNQEKRSGTEDMLFCC